MSPEYQKIFDQTLIDIKKQISISRRLRVSSSACFKIFEDALIPKPENMEEEEEQEYKYKKQMDYTVLTESMVTSYISCYNKVEKNGISLNPNKVYSNMPEYQKIHQKIYDARNKFIGHNEPGDDYIDISNNDEKNHIHLSIYFINKVFPKDWLYDFHKMLEINIKYSEKMIKKNTDRFHKLTGITLSYEFV
ncbi:hypothetical protein FBY51_1807 [Zymomonas mobilis]|uniref:hypothetical protein n=1 Tax=Zymomonas mobilis TaxID=542 RepID=UPI00026D81FD|nr:hypothetical protein [Zymomonas mobilis]AFN57586.1 hypothetical protein ZZ6_1735 [Zymomonas mobilis subsp. mobilis ATCC 29191]TQK74396.1 hypothetical protein FBY53_1821 [Zymomonas mobilis]TQL14637.1 hypothetical protein FBY51_1807 [Zymomonas mobilis]GEB88303.1 hypothetical protein ZMO01_16430 [Zymomonas mobilis subsp. mobilis]